MKTAIICTCLIQHVEGAIKKRPAIATILNKRRDRIGIFKQKKSNYIGFRLDHVISSTNRIDALPPLHIATHPSHPFLDPNPGISYLQGVHLGVCLGVFYSLENSQPSWSAPSTTASPRQSHPQSSDHSSNRPAGRGP